MTLGVEKFRGLDKPWVRMLSWGRGEIAGDLPPAGLRFHQDKTKPEQLTNKWRNMREKAGLRTAKPSRGPRVKFRPQEVELLRLAERRFGPKNWSRKLAWARGSVPGDTPPVTRITPPPLPHTPVSYANTPCKRICTLWLNGGRWRGIVSRTSPASTLPPNSRAPTLTPPLPRPPAHSTASASTRDGRVAILRTSGTTYRKRQPVPREALHGFTPNGALRRASPRSRRRHRCSRAAPRCWGWSALCGAARRWVR